jgi:hypothetical protein
MFNLKTIALTPGLVEGVDGKKFERINTRPYQIHPGAVSDFHDLEGIPVELKRYEYISDRPLTMFERSHFAFQNVLDKAAQFLHEDEFKAAHLHMFISRRKKNTQHVPIPWHSHNFSGHLGKDRELDKLLVISTSNPTQVVKKRNLLVSTHVAKTTSNHLYPEFAQNVQSGNYGEVVSAPPGQFLEIRENESHISPIETEELTSENIFRIFIALYIPYQREQIRVSW